MSALLLAIVLATSPMCGAHSADEPIDLMHSWEEPDCSRICDEHACLAIACPIVTRWQRQRWTDYPECGVVKMYPIGPILDHAPEDGGGSEG